MTLAFPLPVVAFTPIADETVQTVRGRDVHAFLGIGKDFTTWMRVQIERARLKEGRDFIVETGAEQFPQKGENLPAQDCALSDQGVSGKGGRARLEWHLTLDAAKHVGLISGTDRGYELREYFIEAEKRLRATTPSAPAVPQTLPEALRLAADLADTVATQAEAIAVLQPRSEALAAIADAEGLSNVTVAAKALQIAPGELWAYLRRERWVYRGSDGTDVAMQAKITSGCLTHKTVSVDIGRGRTWAKPQVMVTPKGLTILATRFGKPAVPQLPLIQHAPARA